MGRSSFGKLSNIALALADIVLVNLGIALAFWIKFGFNLNVPSRNIEPYFSIIPWLSLSTIVLFYFFDLYTDWRRKGIQELLYTIGLSIVILTCLTLAFTFLNRGFAFPRSVILGGALLQLLLVLFLRVTLWYLAKRKYGKQKVLIIGVNEDDCITIVEKLFHHSKGWFQLGNIILFNDRKSLKKHLDQHDVVLLSPNITRLDKEEIISLCSKHGKEVLIVPQLFELFLLDAEPQQIDDMLVLSITPPELTPAQKFVKRAFDIIMSILLLIILSPIILILFILIPLNSKGPAIFRQERLGKDGKPYNIYKFRSMVSNAEKYTGPVLASENDPRITSLGKYLRATRLDEIPQLFNVLKGDMSLVGPRPERGFFIEQFKKEIPNYSYRMSVKPGITGLAQVMAKYSTDVEDKLRFDLMYVRNYSFSLDIKILFQTLRVVLQREQAEGLKQEEEMKRTIQKLVDSSKVAATKD